MKIDLKRWVTHFRNNQRDRAEPDWDAPLEIHGEARRHLVRSLEQFELGDGGGPAYLIGWNRERFLSQPGARELVDLWFNEEAEHSRLVGGAAARFGGSPIDGHWSFSLFCGLRKFLGVGFELRALLLTEIVSNVYYQMLLRHGGNDPALAQVCRLVIRDETGHIAFHRAHLALNERLRPGPIWSGLFRCMGLAAGTVLWVNHRPALKALGATDKEFYQQIWGDLGRFVSGLRSDRATGRAVSPPQRSQPIPPATAARSKSQPQGILA